LAFVSVGGTIPRRLVVGRVSEGYSSLCIAGNILDEVFAELDIV
jgi:hypothetical protein